MPSATSVPAVVVVTRTGSAGQELTRKLEKNGLPSWHLPTLKIIGQELTLPMVDFQQAIFVSPNAVRFSVEISQTLCDILPKTLIAVGSGTAKCLQQAGFRQIVIPTQANSEGLLELAQLQAIKKQQLLIIKGQGGRELLITTLTSRGAICHTLDVYSRVTTKIDTTLWQEFLNNKVALKVVTVASVDALSAFSTNLDDDFDRQRLTLVVASQRIAKIALKNDYKNVFIAASAANEMMFHEIMCLLDK